MDRDKLIEQMTKALHLSFAFEQDLRKVVRMRRLNPGQEMSAPELNDCLILVGRGLLKEECWIKGAWRCVFFAGQADSFQNYDDENNYRRRNRRFIAIELVTVYFVSRKDIPELQEKHAFFFKKYLDGRDAEGDRLTMGPFKKTYNPFQRIRMLKKRYPGIFALAAKVDLASCLGMDVDEMEECLELEGD